MFIGTDNSAGDMYVGRSSDMLNWKIRPGVWATGRPGYFDHLGLAAGPPPQKLSNGHYLYL